MKEGWEIKKLGEVCDFQGGSQPPKKDWEQEPKDGYVRMLQIRDFTKSRGSIIEYVRKTDKLKYCSSQDILIGRYGASVGKILSGLSGAYNVALIKSIPDENIITKSYIRRYFESAYFQINLQKICHQRAAQAGFSKEDIFNFPIIIPPLSEQQRIVAILDAEFAKIDALKANAEKSLQAAKDLFQSALKHELKPKENWKTKSLKEIGKTQTGTTPKTSDKHNYGSFMPFIKPADINIDGLGGLNYDNEGLSEQGVAQGRLFESQSIFMVCIGSIGKIGYSLRAVSCNQQINVLSPTKDYDYKYLYYYMSSPSFQFKVIKEGESAKATLPIINKTKWENLTITFPESLQEQNAIAIRLDEMNERCKALQENYRKTIALCEDLKQALLRKAFNGEL